VHQAARASLRPRGWKPAARAAGAARRAAPVAARGEGLEPEGLQELQGLEELHLEPGSSPGGGLAGAEGGHGGRDERQEDEDVELQLALALSAADAKAPPALPPGLGGSAAPPGLGAPQRLAASASGAGLPPGLPPGLGR